MIELKYKNWEEISLGKFNEIESVVKSDLSDIDRVSYLLTVLTETDLQTIEGLTMVEYGRLANEMSFIYDMPKVEIKEEYIINGKEYYLSTDFRNFTAGQYIDFQTLYKDLENNKHKLLAVFLIPKGHKYCDDYNVDNVAEEIEQHLSIVDATACMLFFSLLYKGLTIATLTYSIKMMKKEMRKEKNNELKMKMKKAIQKTEESLHLLKSTVGSLW